MKSFTQFHFSLIKNIKRGSENHVAWFEKDNPSCYLAHFSIEKWFRKSKTIHIQVYFFVQSQTNVASIHSVKYATKNIMYEYAPQTKAPEIQVSYPYSTAK